MEEMAEKSEPTPNSQNFVGLFKSMFREMRGNALWDLVKIVLFYAAPTLLFYFGIIPFEQSG